LTVTWVFGVSMAPLNHPMRVAAMVSYLRISTTGGANSATTLMKREAVLLIMLMEAAMQR